MRITNSRQKKFGSLEVLGRINDNAYRLQFLSDITTSGVFNVKYLSRYLPPDQPSDSWSNPLHPGGADTAASLKLQHILSIFELLPFYAYYLIVCVLTFTIKIRISKALHIEFYIWLWRIHF